MVGTRVIMVGEILLCKATDVARAFLNKTPIESILYYSFSSP
jgi:hypothetical protein